MKSLKTLQAINLIHKYFTTMELRLLLTSSSYSILYYEGNSWLIPSLKLQLKQQLLAAASSSLK
jgi:hypothetical protein